MFEPSAFKNDPYGYLTNQIGHIFLGVFLTTAYCWFVDKVSYYPNQVVAAFVVVGVYLLWWELAVQGWRGFDTIEDAFYLGMGASIYTFIDMQWVIDRVFFAFIVMGIPLSIGTLYRMGKSVG